MAGTPALQANRYNYVITVPILPSLPRPWQSIAGPYRPAGQLLYCPVKQGQYDMFTIIAQIMV